MRDYDYRKIGLLVTLIVVVGLLLYQNRWMFLADEPKPVVIVVEDKTTSLPLEEGTRAEIVHFFEGVRIPPEENNLDFVGNLESIGQTQLSEGNDEEAYGTYQRVLAINYQQGNLKGISVALLALSELAERADNQDEALRTAMLSYEIAEIMNNQEEMAVIELRLATLLEKWDGVEMQAGILDTGSEDGAEPTAVTSDSEAVTPPAVDPTDIEPVPPIPDPGDRRIEPVQANPRIIELADGIEVLVGRFRGLPVGQPIAKTFARREEIEKRLLELMNELHPPSQVERNRKALVKLGLIPQNFDLAEFHRGLAVGSTISLYDPRTKALYIDESVAAVKNNEELDGEIVVSLVMSLVHALQDRYLNLNPYSTKVEGNSDASMARSALLLGDALAVRVDYSVNAQLLSPDQVRDVDLSFRQEIESRLGRDVPEALKEISVFPAVSGFKFMRSFRKWNALEEANRLYSDVPSSTEQFVHPEKYLAQRDDPTVVELQSPPDLLPLPWKSIHTDVLGEFSLYLVLNRFIERHKAGRATEGWDGDRLELFEHPSGNLAFVLSSVWDAEDNASRFAEAYSEVVQKKYPGAQLVNTGDNRQTGGRELEWESGSERIILRLNGTQVEILEVTVSPNVG